MSIDWRTIFDEAYPVAGATEDELVRFQRGWSLLLSDSEMDEIRRHQGNPLRPQPDDPLFLIYQSFDPATWSLPNSPLPASYLSFLRYSNGGEFRTGERWFQFFPALQPIHGVRAMLLAYQLPRGMPGAVPFAFNGGGTFYVFDMRRPPVDDEYPIVCTHSGNLGWKPDECWLVATSFLDACTGTIDVDELCRG